MNELFDKLIIRIIFTCFICAIIYFYKIAHSKLHPHTKSQLNTKFYPSKNAASTIHLFSRIIGIGIIFSEFYFYLSDNILITLLDFFIQASSCLFLFLLSTYILESIVLYNFDYNDEIQKRKNISYAIICFALSVAVAQLIKSILIVSSNSLVLLFFLWLFAIVLIGFATKSYQFISKMPFNRLIIQKNYPMSFSYTGFIWGWSLIISTALNHPLNNIKWYSIQVILKILLAAIIFPIFKIAITKIYSLQDEFNQTKTDKEIAEITPPLIGQGIYEGLLFLTCSILTTLITEHVNFGTFYPV